MSREPLPRPVGSCQATGKVTYTRPAARAHAKAKRRRGEGRYGEYHCSACNGWHIGSDILRSRRRRS